MAYTYPDTWSLEAIIDYLWAVQAGLEAESSLAAQVAFWLAFEERVLAERVTRDGDRKGLIKSAAVQRRCDLGWDRTLMQAGTKSFSDAGRSAKKPPYSTLFSTIRPSAATRLGAVKATELGTTIVLKLRELKKPAYDELADELEAASGALEAADKARKGMKGKTETHDLRRRALIDDLETLADKTHIAILTAFPGDDDLVRTILSPWKDATAVNRDEMRGPPTPEPDAPDEA